MKDVLKDVVWIIAALLAIIAGMWVYLKAASSLGEWSERVFGQPSNNLRSPRHRPSKVEIQSLFRGNTKDQDQI